MTLIEKYSKKYSYCDFDENDTYKMFFDFAKDLIVEVVPEEKVNYNEGDYEYGWADGFNLCIEQINKNLGEVLK